MGDAGRPYRWVTVLGARRLRRLPCQPDWRARSWRTGATQLIEQRSGRRPAGASWRSRRDEEDGTPHEKDSCGRFDGGRQVRELDHCGECDKRGALDDGREGAVTRSRDAVGAFILAIVSGKPRTNPYMRLTQPPTMSTGPLVSTIGPSPH